MPTMTITPNPITVDPPPVTVPVGTIRVTPPALDVNPLSLTVTRYNITVTVPLPPVHVEPPSFEATVQARVVDLPPITVQVPAVSVDIPDGTCLAFVDPPAFDYQPPAIRIDPPAFPVTPPAVEVTPPGIEVRFGPYRERIQPPTFTVTLPPVTVDPPAFTWTPPRIHIDPPPLPVNICFAWGGPRYRTLVANGPPANRIDIVFIGDGYTAAEVGAFDQKVQEAIDAFRTTHPLSEYFAHFNFHSVNVVSTDSGVSDPHAAPPRIRRTALGTGFSPISSRRYVGNDAWVLSVVNASGVPCDHVIVIGNTPAGRRGGATLATMQVAYAASGSPDFKQMVVHEASHSIVKLMDEYSELNDADIDLPPGWTPPPPPLPWRNVDTNGAAPKWSWWLTPGVSLPTPAPAPAGTVGAFEGGAYVRHHVYRPQETCLMRDDGRPFCVVCTESWIGQIYQETSLADGFSPSLPFGQVRAGRPVTLRATVIRPNAIRTIWSVMQANTFHWQEVQRSDSYRDFVWTPATPGQWLVRCVLEDPTRDIRDPSIRARATLTRDWNYLVLPMLFIPIP